MYVVYAGVQDRLHVRCETRVLAPMLFAGTRQGARLPGAHPQDIERSRHRSPPRIAAGRKPRSRAHASASDVGGPPRRQSCRARRIRQGVAARRCAAPSRAASRGISRSRVRRAARPRAPRRTPSNPGRPAPAGRSTDPRAPLAPRRRTRDSAAGRPARSHRRTARGSTPCRATPAPGLLPRSRDSCSTANRVPSAPGPPARGSARRTGAAPAGARPSRPGSP